MLVRSYIRRLTNEKDGLMEEIILRMKDITKSFPGVKALKGVSMELRKGEVHALLGENGAGKSTLIKCLGGIYPIDSGSIELDGRKVDIRTPGESMKLGISVIHQELVLAEQLTVADNIFMGMEPANRAGFIDKKKIFGECEEILQSLNAGFHAYNRVFTLSTAQKQMLEIAKAINKQVRILVMDEPTASVSQKEVDKIFDLVRRLKSRGITIVYISHRMDEIFQIADRITVLRDGSNVATAEAESITQDELVHMMVGYDLEQYFARSSRKIGEVVMKGEGLTRSDGKVKDASFELRKGEIIGFAGLVGSGRTELVEMLSGIVPPGAGKLELSGRKVFFKNPRQSLDAGICLVPEDRKHEGLILRNNVRFNLSIGILPHFIRWNYLGVNRRKEEEIAQKYIDKLAIKVSGQQQLAINLSGGNQQKIVLGKWLAASKDIIILDEPTRGIDVGAKAEIYALMDELTNQGKSIIMVSSELPEVINMSDQIYVMREGSICKVYRDRSSFDQQEILRYMLGLQ